MLASVQAYLSDLYGANKTVLTIRLIIVVPVRQLATSVGVLLNQLHFSVANLKVASWLIHCCTQ